LVVNIRLFKYNETDNNKGIKMLLLRGKNIKLGHIRRILLLSIMTIVFINLTAYAEIHLKGMGGWTRSTTDIWHLKPINNFVGGIGVEFWPVEYLGFELDALVVNKGHADPPDRPYYYEKDGTFTQISIPFMLKLRMKLGSFRIGVLEGIAISPIIGEMDSNFHNFDYNLIVGGFIEKWFSDMAMFIDVRYDWGFNYLAIDYVPSRVSFKTRTLYIMGGIKFGL
jgi:hypothetical protein